MPLPADLRVTDGNGNPRDIPAPLPAGRASAAESKPFAIDSETKAVLDTIATNTGGAASNVTEDAASAADPVGPQIMARRKDTLSGAQVSADGDNIALNATSKGELYAKNVDLETLAGAVNETAPANDTANSGQNGRLQRIAQNLTTLLGTKLTAETLGSGGAGLTGWLSEVATRITAMIGTKLTAETLGSGGAGVVGWLSEVATRISAVRTRKIAAYGTKVDVLTTEMNSTANGANCTLGAAWDNSSNRDYEVEFILVIATQGSARSSGAQVVVFACAQVDGTNYDDTNEITARPVYSFSLDAATTARRLSSGPVRVSPCNMKFFTRNLTGQAFASSGNTLSVRPVNVVQ